MSDGNFRVPDPVWSVKRPSGVRCGGGGASGGEIAPNPPTHVSFDTARFNELMTSEMLMRGGGTDCWRCSEEHSMASERSATTNRDYAATGYETCGRIDATATTRHVGEKTDRGLTTFKKGARECCLLRERLTTRGRGRRCNQASWRWSFPVPRGAWGHVVASVTPHNDPHRQ